MAVENVNLAVLGSSVGFKIPLKLWNIPRTRKDYNDKFKQTEVQEPNVSSKDEESQNIEKEKRKLRAKSRGTELMERRLWREKVNLTSAEGSRQPKVTLPSNKEPTFFIGGGNGVAIINDVLEGMNWRRIKEKQDDNYRLKWTETKCAISFTSFREGEQMVNHFPNCQLLTNKMGLLNSLQTYEEKCIERKGKPPNMKLSDFFPETYRLDDLNDRASFFRSFKDGDIWICKPTGRNQGKGIYLVRDKNEIKKLCENYDNNQRPGKPRKPMNRIIQRYITNPLLIDRKKFDIRCYMLIANAVPYLVLFHQGYVRLSIHDYDNNSDNLIAHLTNQFIQKKDPTYKDVKDETTWSMARFNDYINTHYAEDHGLGMEWVYTTLHEKIKTVMQHCFTCVKSKLEAKVGYFELYGYDFMIDTDFNIFLIEININPCLAINCEALKERVPGVVKEAIHLSVECFEKSRRGKPLLPLQSLQGFEIIYQGPSPQPRGSGQGARGRGTSSSSPTRAGYSPTRATSRAHSKDTPSPVRPGPGSFRRENPFVSRTVPREKSEPKQQRPTTNSPVLSTVKENDANESGKETNNDDSTSDEESQVKTEDDSEEQRDQDKSKDRQHQRDSKRNIPKATSTSFDNDLQEIGKAVKSGGRVRSIQNDTVTSQGRSKRSSTKETAKPVPIPLGGQSSSAVAMRKSTFPPLIDNSLSPYSVRQAMGDPVKLRMSHGATSPAKRSKSRSKEQEIANRGS